MLDGHERRGLVRAHDDLRARVACARQGHMCIMRAKGAPVALPDRHRKEKSSGTCASRSKSLSEGAVHRESAMHAREEFFADDRKARRSGANDEVRDVEAAKTPREEPQGSRSSGQQGDQECRYEGARALVQGVVSHNECREAHCGRVSVLRTRSNASGARRAPTACEPPTNALYLAATR